MRAFIALELPDSVRATLQSYQRQLIATGADVKWVEAENLHVTMRFLGEISVEQFAAVDELARRIAGGTRTFDVRLSQPGAFPSIRAPRVVWMGIADGAETLSSVVRDLEVGLGTIGISGEERAFVPHVTLGRVRSPRGRRQLVDGIEQADWRAPEPFRADALTLFESRISSGGPAYSVVSRAPFGA